MQGDGASSSTFCIRIDPQDDEFSLVDAACSFGYFLLSPNVYDKELRTWSRPFLVPSSNGLICVHACISQDASGSALRVAASVDAATAAVADSATRQELSNQVKRSLRIGSNHADEKRRAYMEIYYGQGRAVAASAASSSSSQPIAQRQTQSFRGRLFRSPTLWEDAVKTITCTNIAWSGTRRMNRGLCSLRADGAFPSPADVLAHTEEELKTEAGVGYRARRLIQLAELFASGRISEAILSPPVATADDALAAVLRWPGVGPYAGRALCQLLGHFDFVPVDTETLRHLREYHGLSSLTMKEAAAAADRVYAPYKDSGTSFLAFWGELWGEYERRLGVIRDMDSSEYDRFTAREMKAAAADGKSKSKSKGRGKGRGKGSAGAGASSSASGPAGVDAASYATNGGAGSRGVSYRPSLARISYSRASARQSPASSSSSSSYSASAKSSLEASGAATLARGGSDRSIQATGRTKLRPKAPVKKKKKRGASEAEADATEGRLGHLRPGQKRGRRALAAQDEGEGEGGYAGSERSIEAAAGSSTGTIWKCRSAASGSLGGTGSPGAAGTVAQRSPSQARASKRRRRVTSVGVEGASVS